jgi:CRISPR-associated protein Csx17
LWLPLWSEPVTFAEAKHLFAEGRAQLGRRQARNAVEFALALNLLGISRGVTSFARYGFLKRNGLAFLAAPLGRVDVVPRPQARLLDDSSLADWVGHLRSACRDKEKTPTRYQSALRQIDRAIFQFANRSEQGNDAKHLLDVLIALARAERTLANGLAFCKDKHIRPLQGLNPQWLVDAAPQGVPGREFRLAASLASIVGEPRSEVGPLRTHLEAVEQAGQWVKWSPGSTSAVWTNRGLAGNLAGVLIRRLMESEKAGSKGCSLGARVFAPLEDVVAFINSETDDDELADLLWALIGLKWTANDFRRRDFHEQLSGVFRVPHFTPAPLAYGLIRLVLAPVPLVIDNLATRADSGPRWRVAGKNERAELTTTPSAAPFHQLARGAVAQAENLAARRLWSDRIVPFGWGNRGTRKNKYETGLAIDSGRLLAACLFPLSSNALTRLARQVLNPPAVVS